MVNVDPVLDLNEVTLNTWLPLASNVSSKALSVAYCPLFGLMPTSFPASPVQARGKRVKRGEVAPVMLLRPPITVLVAPVNRTPRSRLHAPDNHRIEIIVAAAIAVAAVWSMLAGNARANDAAARRELRDQAESLAIQWRARRLLVEW